MKCDVCGTRIPMGAHECPQCGYKIGKLYASDYDSSGTTHDHIQTKTMDSQNHYSKEKNVFFPKTEMVKLIAVVVAIITFIGIVYVPKFFGSDDVNGKSYQELLDIDFDQELVENAISDEKELTHFFQTEVGIVNPDVDEYSEKKDNMKKLVTTVSGEIGNCTVGIVYTYINGFDVEKEMFTLCDSNESIKTAEKLEGDQNVIDLLGNKIGIKNLYLLMDHSRLLLEKQVGEGEHLIYQNRDRYDIFMTEDYYPDASKPYYKYYFSIGPL